jgi:hypothetical protein
VFGTLPSPEDLKANRDNFAELDGTFAPPSMPTWTGVNAAVDQKSARSRHIPKWPYDKCYFFPDPGLFFGAEKERKAAAYFKQWEHIKSVWIMRAFSLVPRPCTPQEWREILSLGIIKTNTNPSTATSNAIEKARKLIGECLDGAGITVHSLKMPMRGDEELQSLRFDRKRGQELIWELCEFNFRWELFSLDFRLTRPEGKECLRRNQMLLRCFSMDFECLTSVDPSHASSGMAAPTFTERFPYLQAFWALMDSWPIPKPHSWNSCPNPVLSPLSDRWERDVIYFYAQTFFDHFHRPAILPRTLHP